MTSTLYMPASSQHRTAQEPKPAPMDPLPSLDPAPGFCGCLKGLALGPPHLLFPLFCQLRSLHSGLILEQWRQIPSSQSLQSLTSPAEVTFPGSPLPLLNSHLIPEAFQCRAEKSILHTSASFIFRAIDHYFHFKQLCVHHLLLQ